MTTVAITNSGNRGAYLKIIIIWMAILLMGSFWLSIRNASEPISMTVVPQAPRQGEPIVATFKMNNTSPDYQVTSYEFYANGMLLQSGDTTISPNSSKVYQYVYQNPLQMGEQINFMVKTESNQGNYEKVLSTPPYPPQIMSSFVSFASFSSLLMSSMTSMSYYQFNFASDAGFNVGIMASAVLIALLIFMELPLTRIQENSHHRGKIKDKIFHINLDTAYHLPGMVFTKIAMVIAS